MTLVYEGFENLVNTVIGKGLCTACGTCVGVCPAECLSFDDDSEIPKLCGECTLCEVCSAVCPGRDIPLPEMEQRFLGMKRRHPDDFLGLYRHLYQGYAVDALLRQKAASGGTATALLKHAMNTGFIDGALVVGMDPEFPWRAKPFIARTPDEIETAAKSKYCICPVNQSLNQIADLKHLAVVGLPCHIHGIRKIQMNRTLDDLGQRIVLSIGLYCGSNVSFRVTEHVIIELAGVTPSDVIQFEYRGGPQSQDTVVRTRDGREITIPNAARLATYLWLQNDRCRMCCDWTAEIADLSLGDIFYPPLDGPWRKVPNWNSIIVRNNIGKRLIDSALAAGLLYLDHISEESFYGNIGFESKKHGAVYKLNHRKSMGWPTPDYGYKFELKPYPRHSYPVPMS